MKRIAVASEGKLVTAHFGHCENFYIYDIDDGRVVNSESIPNPGHKPGFLPNFLYGKGVNVIITGGIGQGAIDIFNEKGINVVSGAQGEAEQSVLDYISGDLKSTKTVCHEHKHHGSC